VDAATLDGGSFMETHSKLRRGRAILPEVVPREDLLPAIALNGIEFKFGARDWTRAGRISDCGRGRGKRLR